MKAVSVREAKSQFSRLIERVAQGESVVITQAGKPLLRLTPIDSASGLKRLGFLKGEIDVPDDFDRMGEGEIAALFGIGGTN